MRQDYKLLFCLTLLFSYFTASSQEYREAYENFDDFVNKENTNLFYGKEYVEQHALINNKHKFFSKSSFLKGEVVYSGQIYHDLDLKYNIFDDLLIVKIEKQAGDATFELFKNRIQKFSIDGHTFINIPPKNNTEVHGFFEVLRETHSLTLLKNHRKKINKLLTKNFTYFEFEPEPAQYVISISEEYYKINSQSDWAKVFPEHIKKIDSYFNNKKALRESAPDRFMLELFLDIAEIYNPNNL
ncbi:hypothetical protein [Salegentibacter sp. Hel_I_6]|uniref:hypothetical protein n=1 Tax=Salegentibacter sp. Hel_I_6 TaxID=1250278 RepID=UPI0005623151|nr:hypothetical protein [Salegentibacter sp. Hel_I_6]